MNYLRPLALLALLLPLASSLAASAARPFSEGSWQELLRAHKGEPTIVHFWGLTCGPCLAELPTWSKFAADHPGVRLVLVNWDSRGQDLTRAEATLRKSGLSSTEAWALATPFEEKARFEIDRDWFGELPRTLLIAGDGSTTAYSGAADMEKLDAWSATQLK